MAATGTDWNCRMKACLRLKICSRHRTAWTCWAMASGLTFEERWNCRGCSGGSKVRQLAGLRSCDCLSVTKHDCHLSRPPGFLAALSCQVFSLDMKGDCSSGASARWVTTAGKPPVSTTPAGNWSLPAYWAATTAKAFDSYLVSIP